MTDIEALETYLDSFYPKWRTHKEQNYKFFKMLLGLEQFNPRFPKQLRYLVNEPETTWEVADRAHNRRAMAEHLGIDESDRSR